MKVVISHHAATRAKQRLGLKRPSLDKAASTALAKGLSPQQTAGRLRRYLDSQAAKGSRPRVWSEHIYLFGRDDVLITVLDLPRGLRRAAASCLQKRKRGGAQ